MSFQVVGLGNALMDALVVIEDESHMASFHLARGTTHMVDHETWEKAYNHVRQLRVTFDSGGSCANTIATVGLLGAQAVFCGQVGDDQMGQMYGVKLDEACGTHALRFTNALATGKCLSVISAKDAERTMITDLGANTELTELGDFKSTLGAATVAHYEGYMLLGPESRAMVFEGMTATRAGGGLVSLDVSDPFVVGAVKDIMWSLLREHVDIVFLNAEEARALTGQPPEEAVHQIAKQCNVATVVVKLGNKGSLIFQDGTLYRVGIRLVKAIDTTGAGDAYAGGYLYGVVMGWDPQRSGELAAAVAGLTVSQIGAVAKNREALASLLHEIAPPPTGSAQA